MSLDARISIIASGLEKLGVPKHCTVPMAYGLAQMLWRSTWSRCTDVLGLPMQIEERCGWKLPAGTLVPLFIVAGLILEDTHRGLPRYLDLYAWSEAPESARKQWKRKNASSYERAAARGEEVIPVQPLPVPSAEPIPPPPPPPEPVVEEKTKDLFGNPVEPEDETPASKGPKHATVKQPKTAHPDLVDHWCDRWSAAEGSKYPFTARDAKHIAELLKFCGEVAEAKRIIDIYLFERDKWYAGHPLGKLLSDLPKFKSRRLGANGLGCEGLRTNRVTNVSDPAAVLRDLGATEANVVGDRHEAGELPF